LHRIHFPDVWSLGEALSTEFSTGSLGVDSNPWGSFPRIICSMDYLRQGDILSSFVAATNSLSGRFEAILPWQMLIIDEAHNLTPSHYGDNSDRCEMLRRITPFFEHRLFLSATPHNGYTVSFTGLLELLDWKHCAKRLKKPSPVTWSLTSSRTSAPIASSPTM
jgi:hypothetical protein